MQIRYRIDFHAHVCIKLHALLLLRRFWRTKQFIIFDESYFCRNKKRGCILLHEPVSIPSRMAGAHPHIFHFFITFLRIVFNGSEDAVTCQCARYGNAADRVASFKIKRAKHSCT